MYELKKRYKGCLLKAIYDIKTILGIKEYSFATWKGLSELAKTYNFFNNENTKSIFVSKEAEIIYVLLNHSGKERIKRLGITSEMYSSLNKSKNWYRPLAKLLHPDNSNHDLSNEAISELNNIYEKMKKYGK